MEKIIDRVYKVFEAKNTTKGKFEKRNGLSNAYFASREKSKTKTIKADVLAHLINNYPDININWVLTGKGEMIQEQLNQEAYDILSNAYKNSQELLSRYKKDLDSYQKKFDKTSEA